MYKPDDKVYVFWNGEWRKATVLYYHKKINKYLVMFTFYNNYKHKQSTWNTFSEGEIRPNRPGKYWWDNKVPVVKFGE